ncbi:MAG: hypothetical protein JWN75_1181 [Candidatus Saccharibacteria bacterium]|nr:hypothetical protein [Candidatus Saccharibacteria bacterium]
MENIVDTYQAIVNAALNLAYMMTVQKDMDIMDTPESDATRAELLAKFEEARAAHKAAT